MFGFPDFKVTQEKPSTSSKITKSSTLKKKKKEGVLEVNISKTSSNNSSGSANDSTMTNSFEKSQTMPRGGGNVSKEFNVVHQNNSHVFEE